MIINSGTSRNPQAMNLMRCLTFMSGTLELRISALHFSESHNILADALSRNNVPLFHSLHQQATQDASAIPPAALDLILLCEPNWNA